MEILQINNLSFSYPESPVKALDGVSLSIREGAFVCVYGLSGCGKTTLLTLLKKSVSPFGTRTGAVLYRGTDIRDLDDRRAAAEIGYVGQDPDGQIVTDTVWHELAFGLESLGFDTPQIRRRVAELGVYFNMEPWFHQETASLSGGQKQLLNLASVMVMGPSVLLLDEPTARMDPVAAAHFTDTVKKLNRELGLTVVIAEHRLEQVLPDADLAVFLEEGRVAFSGTPREAVRYFGNHPGNPMAEALPAAARLHARMGGSGETPMTVQEGRAYLASVLGRAEAEGPGAVTAGKSGAAVPGLAEAVGPGAVTAGKPGATVLGRAEVPGDSGHDRHETGQTEALSLADVWFRYGQTRPDVLKGVFLTVRRGEHYCLLGSNGAGKSTLLEVITGALAPYRGRVRVCGEIRKRGKAMEASGRVNAMPQDPKLLFLSDTLREDFRAACRMGGVPKEMWDSRILDEARAWGIEGLLDRHPYDLSGGEKQKAAFVKVLLPGPSLVLLDEPAKGMDAAAKARLASGIRKLAGAGIGVMTVTHDVEFAAESADRVGMLYDGVIVSEDTPARFFTDNLFFTTAAASLTRGFLDGTVTVEAAVGEILRRRKEGPHA